jgi:hypothetical protein
MAVTSLADLTAGTRQTIGRYFSVVSMVPSLLFVVYVYLLVRSGAWSHSPSWGSAMNALVNIGIGGAVILIVLGVALGLGVHPIQFGLVQFLEGYWGTNPIARKFRAVRIMHHRNRASTLDDMDVEGDLEAGRLLAQYPRDPELIMPTRLGNVLRRYETLAGRQYDLKVLTILPHVALASRVEDVKYLDDQRMQLDLAVRMCFTALLASAASAAFLCRDGAWLLVAMIPSSFAYLAYRGAVITAREYGIAMMTLVDLNRFSLYERLHLPMPQNIEEERTANKRLMQLLEANSKHVFMRYSHPQASGGSISSSG